MKCWLVEVGVSRAPCEAPWDWCHIGFTEHWLSKSPTGPRLSKEEANDPRLLKLCCRADHHSLDQGNITLTQTQLPESVWEYAREHGLEWKLRKDHAP